MRSYQVFAAMPPEQATQVLRTLAEHAPATYASSLQLASAAFKTRPAYLRRQPFEKRAAYIRRALARVASNVVAQEILAVYFLECRKPLLVEWLDLLGIEHEDGLLSEDTPAPPAEGELREAAERFRAADDDPERELLLHAFAAQDSIDWPALEALVSASPPQLPGAHERG
jgi:hypothetical protein